MSSHAPGGMASRVDGRDTGETLLERVARIEQLLQAREPRAAPSRTK